MTPTEVYQIVSDFGNARVGPHGVEWGPLRIERGSGIAGKGSEWWIVAPGNPDWVPLGPIRSRRGFRRVLRQIVIDMLKLGDALASVDKCWRQYAKETAP